MFTRISKEPLAIAPTKRWALVVNRTAQTIVPNLPIANLYEPLPLQEWGKDRWETVAISPPLAREGMQQCLHLRHPISKTRLEEHASSVLSQLASSVMLEHTHLSTHAPRSDHQTIGQQGLLEGTQKVWKGVYLCRRRCKDKNQHKGDSTDCFPAAERKKGNRKRGIGLQPNALLSKESQYEVSSLAPSAIGNQWFNGLRFLLLSLLLHRKSYPSDSFNQPLQVLTPYTPIHQRAFKTLNLFGGRLRKT